MSYQPVRSVIKALHLLELIRDNAMQNKSITLQEISQKAGIPSVTARNLLWTLEECGYVKRISHGRYEEGEKCFQLLHSSGGTIRRLEETARPILEQAVRDVGEDFLLCILSNGKRVELLRIKANHRAAPDETWRANADFYRMRTTRVILAWYSRPQLDFFLERNGLPGNDSWPETGGTLEGFLAELKRIRREGGCNNLILDKIAALAVPILTDTDEVLGALGCFFSSTKSDLVRRAGIFTLLHDYAKKIASGL